MSTTALASFGTTVRLVLAVALLASSAGGTSRAGEQTVEELPVLVHVGPWPTASRLVVYDERLWFVNSVKGHDHNSADIYSVDPADGTVRYEHHLWSQDAGHPLVANGLLYWPYEDALITGGWGTFEVTNGQGWTTGLIATQDIFHVHDMAALDGRLYAATSAFATGLEASDDGGRTWATVFVHPMPDDKLRRIVRLAVLDGTLFGELRASEGRTLLVLGDNGTTTPGEWPCSEN